MIKQFTRTFRLLERLFPGSQIGFPSKVSDELLMVTEMLRPSFLHDARLTLDQQTAATGGGLTQLNHPEPSQGFVHLPMALVVNYDGAANVRADVQLIATTSTLDPWGRWTSSDRNIGSVFAAANISVHAPVVPYSRGNRIRVEWPAPAAATNVTSNLLFVEVPGEICDLQTWLAYRFNFTNTRALP